MGDPIITVTAPADEPNALAAALDYAARGWRVIPIKAGGKHPPVPEWQRAATTDPAVITNWWTQLYRGCGVGIATGPASGVWVLDIDISGDKAGDQTLKELEARYGQLPATVTARTGSGGAHLFFACDDDTVRNNQSGKLGPGLDVRGDGGQVVAAPTIHPNGTRYTWHDGHAPGDLPVAPAPTWLLELLAAEDTATDSPTDKPAPTIPMPQVSGYTAGDTGEDSIAAWFNDTTTWDQLLTDDGWTRARGPGDEQRWTRPGKSARDGISATVGHQGRDVLKVFTSSIPELEADGAYSRFGYEAQMRHRGDRSACAAALRRRRNDIEGTTRQPEDWSIYILPGQPSPAIPPSIAPTTDEPAPWVDPDPLEAAIGYGPPFPIEVLPKWMTDQIGAVTRSFQVPPDLPAMLALGALSVATMGRLKVNLTGSRWTENTNIYSVCAMPPGAGKSPVFKTMTGCLVDLQTQLMDMAAQTVREAEAKKELLDRKAKAAFDKAAKLDATDHDMLQAVDLKAQAEDIQIPPKPRLLAEDTTPEALVSLMGQHGGRMALLSSEGGIFDMMAGQYADRGKTANLAVYLQGWSGDAITQDRVGRAAIQIKEALLAICVTTQPSVLARLGENPELAGRGLPVRFMFSVPPSNVGARDRYAVLRDVDPQVQKTYDSTIHELGMHLARYATAATLELSIEARDLFLAWDQEIEHLQAPGEDLEGLAEWVSKLRATVLRLVGLLHVAEGGTVHDTIEVASMARALVISEYWLAHSLVVHETWAANSDPVKSDARAIVVWATNEGHTEFSASDLQKNMRRRFARIADVAEPLELLVNAGWLRAESGLPVKVGQPGKPSPRFELHPLAADHLANGANGAKPPTGEPEPSRHSRFVVKGVSKDLPTYFSTQTPEPPPPDKARMARTPANNPTTTPTTTQRDETAPTEENPWSLI